MRRVLFATTFALAVLVSAAPSFGQIDAADAGALEEAHVTSSEGLTIRLGKAVVFGVVVSALLVAGGMWRRGRRTRRPRARR